MKVPDYKMKRRDRAIYGNDRFSIRHNETQQYTEVSHRFGTFLKVDDKDWDSFVDAVKAADRRLHKIRTEIE